MSAPSVIVAAIERMSPADRQKAYECSEHYKSEWRLARKAGLNAESLAASVHDHIDRGMDEMLATSPSAAKVQCRKGCAACCRMHISVTPQEAELLVMYAAEQRVEIDRQRLKRQAKKTLATWDQLSPADKRCVFLAEDQSCSVYEHRPSACRKYLVATDPDLCDMDKHPGGTVGVVFSVDAELSHHAALSVFGHGDMPKMVRAAINNRKTK